MVQDTFWDSVYGPIFIRVLIQLQQSSVGTKHSAESDINWSIENGIQICTNQPRSVSHLFLSNLQAEFEDRTQLDAKSTKIFLYLMDILKDITGKHKLVEIDFFCRLRHLYYTSSITQESKSIDEFIFSHIFFILPTKHSKFFPVTLLSMIEHNATFSEQSIRRYYHCSKWNIVASMSLSSQLALCYVRDDPVRQLVCTGFHKQPTQRCIDFDQESGTQTDLLYIAKELSVLLNSFYRPLPSNLRTLYMLHHVKHTNYPFSLRADLDRDVLVSSMQRGETHTSLTTLPRIVCEQHNLIFRMGVSEPLVSYSPRVFHSLNQDLSANPLIVIAINTDDVRDQNICIDFNHWLIDAIPSTRAACNQKDLLICPRYCLTSLEWCSTTFHGNGYNSCLQGHKITAQLTMRPLSVQAATMRTMRKKIAAKDAY